MRTILFEFESRILPAFPESEVLHGGDDSPFHSELCLCDF